MRRSPHTIVLQRIRNPTNIHQFQDRLRRSQHAAPSTVSATNCFRRRLNIYRRPRPKPRRIHARKRPSRSHRIKPSCKSSCRRRTINGFQTQELLVPAGAREYRAKFFVLAEYDYESTMSTDVCINPALITLEKSEVCTPQERQSFGGQGGPMSISSVEQRVQRTGDLLFSQFIFTIENRGDR